jgi:hypothetical protein
MRLILMVCLLASCATAPRPDDLVQAYRKALTEKSGRRAYELLSAAEKRAIPWDRFQLEWRANEKERTELAAELGYAASTVEVRRSVLLSDGRRVELTESAGWRLTSPRLRGPDCPSPEAALKQLLEAAHAEEKSPFLSALSPAFRKELLQQLHERERALESATPEALEVFGDRARLHVGRFRVELRQIDGQWRVDDLN